MLYSQDGENLDLANQLSHRVNRGQQLLEWRVKDMVALVTLVDLNDGGEGETKVQPLAEHTHPPPLVML